MVGERVSRSGTKCAGWSERCMMSLLTAASSSRTDLEAKKAETRARRVVRAVEMLG